MLMEGGDTDTNAAIVGGLIGAAVGFSNIPEKIKNPMLTCNTKGFPNQRPDFLNPAKSNLVAMITKIFENCEKNIEIIDPYDEKIITKPEVKKIKK